MDKNIPEKYEQVAENFHPFEFATFFEQIENLTTRTDSIIHLIINKCREHFISIAEEGINIDVLKKTHDLMEETLKDNNQQAVIQLWSKINEIMQASNEKCRNPTEDNDGTTAELEKELQELERQYAEQTVFQNLLRQELNEFSVISEILDKLETIENISKDIEKLHVPTEVVNQMIDVVNSKADFKNDLCKLPF